MQMFPKTNSYFLYVILHCLKIHRLRDFLRIVEEDLRIYRSWECLISIFIYQIVQHLGHGNRQFDLVLFPLICRSTTAHRLRFLFVSSDWNSRTCTFAICWFGDSSDFGSLSACASIILDSMTIYLMIYRLIDIDLGINLRYSHSLPFSSTKRILLVKRELINLLIDGCMKIINFNPKLNSAKTRHHIEQRVLFDFNRNRFFTRNKTRISLIINIQDH